MAYKYNFDTGKLDYYQPADLPVVPDVQVFFSTDLPTDVGVVFTPDTPALTDTLYISEISGQVFIYKDGAYATYTSPTPNNTPFYLYGTTLDAGGNKTGMIDRSGSIAAPSFNNKRGWTNSGINDGNKWFKVFEYQMSLNFVSDSFKVQMNEFGNPVGLGKSIIFDIILKRQDPNTFLTVNVESGVTTFDLTNVEFLYNTTTKVVSFFYRPTTTYSVTNWLVLNSYLTSTTNLRILWFNTLIGASLAGQPNDALTSKVISLNKINGVYTLPTTKATVAGQVLGDTLADGNLAWVTAGSALTYFTEAQNTSAPNATVPVDSLTAVSGTTNADFAVIPKGNGAILASIPDNLPSGGNKRGANAVDLQRGYRAYNYQVASGVGSAILGGKENMASGDYSVTAGNANLASGFCSTTFGNSNQATYDYAVAIGYYNRATTTSMGLGWSNLASGVVSVAIGNANNATASRAIAIGDSNTASGDYSLAMGFSAHTYGLMGRSSFSATNVFGSGSAQKSTLILVKRTTNATPIALSVDNGIASSTNQLVLQNNNVFRVKGSITGKQSGSTNVGVWDIDCVIVRGVNAASTVVLVPNVNLVVNTGSFGTPTLTANTTLGCLTVTVTGVGSTNIQWTCLLETIENIYA